MEEVSTFWECVEEAKQENKDKAVETIAEFIIYKDKVRSSFHNFFSQWFVLNENYGIGQKKSKRKKTGNTEPFFIIDTNLNETYAD